ncbi:MAG: DoxX family protein [Chitinophagaceae bacterium]
MILLPNFWKLKEWVYAGFVFLMGGAIFSHLSAGYEPIELLGPVLLLLLSLLSWQLQSYRTRIAIP